MNTLNCGVALHNNTRLFNLHLPTLALKQYEPGKKSPLRDLTQPISYSVTANNHMRLYAAKTGLLSEGKWCLCLCESVCVCVFITWQTGSVFELPQLQYPVGLSVERVGGGIVKRRLQL